MIVIETEDEKIEIQIHEIMNQTCQRWDGRCDCGDEMTDAMSDDIKNEITNEIWINHQIWNDAMQ